LITINSERGLVRIENWDDVEGTPGFTRDINPKEAELDRILGNYRLADLVVCGLSSCHHKHFRGYLVATKDGRVTNIGHDCGRTHFGVDFETLAAAFDRDMRDAERRETLHAFKHRLEDYMSTVEQIKTELKGATWLNKQLSDLRHPEHGLPTPIRRVLDEMVRTQSSTLKRQRLATAREIEMMRETGSRASEKPNGVVIEEDIGSLSGLSVLYPEKNIREILIKDIEVRLNEFRSVVVDTASRYELSTWAKWVSEIDAKLKTCREIIEAGRAFFSRENIAKLAELTENAADERQIMAIARRC
jgi:hypothetical protein